MRKFSVLLLAFLMVGGFAFGLDVAITGNASLTWGVDLDEGTTGFVNAKESKAVVTLTSETISSKGGSGWYGLIEIKANALTVTAPEGDDGWIAFGVDVTKAEITDGTVYISILKPDTAFDFAKSVEVVDDDPVQNLVSGGVFADGFTVGVRGQEGVLNSFGVSLVSRDGWKTEDVTNTNDYGLAAKAGLTLVPGVLTADVAFRTELIADPTVGLGVGATVTLDGLATIGLGFDSLVSPDFVGEVRADVAITAVENVSIFTKWYLGDIADADALYVDSESGFAATFAPMSLGASVLLRDVAGDMTGKIKGNVGYAEGGLSTKAEIESPLDFATLKLTLTVGLGAAFHDIDNTSFEIKYVSNDVLAFDANKGILTFMTKITF